MGSFEILNFDVNDKKESRFLCIWEYGLETELRRFGTSGLLISEDLIFEVMCMRN